MPRLRSSSRVASSTRSWSCQVPAVGGSSSSDEGLCGRGRARGVRQVGEVGLHQAGGVDVDVGRVEQRPAVGRPARCGAGSARRRASGSPAMRASVSGVMENVAGRSGRAASSVEDRVELVEQRLVGLVGGWPGRRGRPAAVGGRRPAAPRRSAVTCWSAPGRRMSDVIIRRAGGCRRHLGAGCGSGRRPARRSASPTRGRGSVRRR